MSTLPNVNGKGVLASRPASNTTGGAGSLYFSTDNAKIYRDNGTSWDDVTPGGGGATAAAVQQESFTYAADTGAANAYAVALSPAPTLVAGSEVVFKATNASTGAATLAVNGGTAIPIRKGGATALASGDIAAGQIVALVYDGTNWQIPAPGASGGGGSTAFNINSQWSVDDFLSSSLVGYFNWWVNSVATGSATWTGSSGASSESARPGFWDLTSGTTSNAWATMVINNTAAPIFLPSGATSSTFSVTVQSAVKNVSTNGYNSFGFAGQANAPNPSNFIGFVSDPVANSNSNWWTWVANGGTVTKVDTGVSSLSWHNLQIAISGTSVTFTIDGTVVGSGGTAPSALSYWIGYTSWNKNAATALVRYDWFAFNSNAR